MFDAVRRLPVPLQRVDADLAGLRHVRVEDLREEETLRRLRREVLSEDELDAEMAAGIRRARWHKETVETADGTRERTTVIVSTRKGENTITIG